LLEILFVHRDPGLEITSKRMRNAFESNISAVEINVLAPIGQPCRWRDCGSLAVWCGQKLATLLTLPLAARQKEIV